MQLLLLTTFGLLAVADAERGDIPPIIYFHNHKAGGTTMCLSVLHKITDDCECPDGIIDWFDPIGTAERMVEAGTLFCSLEETYHHPTAEVLKQFAAKWPGHIGTTIRDPWARAKSAFEREIDLKGHLVDGLTIENFLSPSYESKNTRKWGPYNRPEFYTWSFAGCDFETSQGCPQQLTKAHCAQAFDALDSLTHVFVLEDTAHQNDLLANFTYGKVTKFTSPRTNNAFSPLYSKKGGEDYQQKYPNGLPRLPDMEYYARASYLQNTCDYALYSYSKFILSERNAEAPA